MRGVIDVSTNYAYGAKVSISKSTSHQLPIKSMNIFGNPTQEVGRGGGGLTQIGSR